MGKSYKKIDIILKSGYTIMDFNKDDFAAALKMISNIEGLTIGDTD